MTTGRWEDEIADVEEGRGPGRGASHVAHVMLFAIVAFFITFLLWSHNATLEEVTRGEGKIVPSGQTKTVQHFEGGIITEILVEEGEVVEEGDVIMRVENRSAEAQLSEKLKLYRNLRATAARLAAETRGSDTISFPPELQQTSPEVLRNERLLFESRKRQIAQQINILEDQRVQKTQELQELTAKVAQAQAALELSRQEEELIRPLVQQGASSRIDLLRIEQKMQELGSEIESVQLALPRTRSAISEANRRIEEKRTTFITEAQQQLNDVRVEAERTKEEIEAGVDRAQRTDVRSPVRGTVNKLVLNTLGGVVQPGDPVAEIVPLGDSLVVEARIKPSDRAQLYRGLPATVKVSAYDFSIYGGLDAELFDISADTLLDEEGGSYYRIRLRTGDSTLGEDKPIIPGMTATVDILTGEKTVLQYLLKPIIKAKQNAMREK
jgi:adhesin transport system membrane fusion protein